MLDTNDKLVRVIDSLFISSKKKRIEQQNDGSYFTLYNGLSKQHLLDHIQGNKTIGIFSGDVYSKYICFDVDTGKYQRSIAKRDTKILIYTLISEFNLSKDYITVVDSGNKGYHVYLFFDDVIHVEYLRAFYREVIERAGYDPTDIEFRPTDTQAVKLPLGIHKVTGRRCSFVDYMNNFKVLDNEHLYNINRLNADSFKTINNLKDLYELQNESIYLALRDSIGDKDARRFADICQTLDLTEYQIEHAQQDIIKILKTKVLLYPNTRNKYTLLIAIFLKAQGYEMPDVETTINEIMLNSKRAYNGLVQSSEHHIERETKKIVKYVFGKNVSMARGNKTVYLSVDEIKDILALNNLTLMKLYLSMMVHAKRHQKLGDTSFYMAYSVMANYGNAKNRATLRKYISKLEKLERVEVVQSNEIDTMRSEIEGHRISKTNVYRIKKSFNQNFDKKVIVKADVTNVDIQDVIVQAYKNNVINFQYLKSNLSRRQLDKVKQSL